MRQRAELLDRKTRLAEAKRELLEVPGVSEMRDKKASNAKKRAQNSLKHATVSAPAVQDSPAMPSAVLGETTYVEVSYLHAFV